MIVVIAMLTSLSWATINMTTPIQNSPFLDLQSPNETRPINGSEVFNITLLPRPPLYRLNQDDGKSEATSNSVNNKDAAASDPGTLITQIDRRHGRLTPSTIKTPPELLPSTPTSLKYLMPKPKTTRSTQRDSTKYEGTSEKEEAASVPLALPCLSARPRHLVNISWTAQYR